MEIAIETSFELFKSSYQQGSQEEKENLLVQCLAWSKQQAEQLNFPDAMQMLLPDQEGSSGKVQNPIQYPSDQVLIPQDIRTILENEIHLRQIASKIEQVFWLRDLRTERVLYASPIFELIWGRTCEELYSNPAILIDSVHPEDRIQVLVARPQNSNPFNQAYRILRPDGSVRWIFNRTFLINNAANEPAYLFCIAQDITNQKDIELALHRTLDRSREQFDLSHKMSLTRKPDAVLRTLMSAFVLRSAQRATLLFFDHTDGSTIRGMEVAASWLSKQTMTSWTSEPTFYEEPGLVELFQQHRIVVITDTESDPRLTPALKDLLLDGQIHSIIVFPLLASGKWIGCLLIYYEQQHQFDTVELRQLKVLVDQATITLFNLQLLEIEAESRHEAERANEIKTEFLAMISHELRTPLTSIIGFTTTLLADDVTWDADETRDFILTIQQEADRLHELIDHLLDLSRLEAGMLPITIKPSDLHDIIKDALPQFQILTKEYSFTLRIPAQLSLINADEKRIAQVLVNLVRNAATYAPKGTEINISASVRGGFVQINVNDLGPGIPPAEHKKVFKAFSRGVSSDNGSIKGAGLGLAICKGLIVAHGGRIWIKKKSVLGTTISFTVPLFPEPVSVPPVREEV
jgi:PAS domain S-box-containing protein